MSARAFLRDLRHYSSYVIDQAALGVFQACAIAAEKVIDAYAPLEAREMQRAAERLAEVEEQIDVWESESEWLGNHDFSAVSEEEPKPVEWAPVAELPVHCSYPMPGSTTAIAMSDCCRMPADSVVVIPDKGDYYYRCHEHAGLIGDGTKGEESAAIPTKFSAVNGDDAEFSPGAVSVPPTPPAPGHPNPSPASAPAAHHRVAGGNSPGAACDTPLSPAPGHPTTTHLLLDAANQLALWRNGARMSDRRSDRLDELIPEMHARADELEESPSLAEWLVPAVCDVLAEHRPIERGFNRDGTVLIQCAGCLRTGDSQDWREHVAPLISERIAAVLPRHPNMDAAQDAAFTTVVNQHAEALRHLD